LYLYNHYSSKLSETDLEMVKNIPPGGNWKNIPESIPSKRLERIRTDYELGKGSRSTYYGRLTWDKPSYTITTYFNRPGNGCFIHPEQNRLLSLREGARLQTFPDNFRFLGSNTSIYTQIGNAVPPILAYQIARLFDDYIENKTTIDLFCGAGGLSLGFHLNQWNILGAVDNNQNALKTYNYNFGNIGEQLDLSDNEARKNYIDNLKKKIGDTKIGLIVGGPPCQGFSTAGNKRFIEDPRNHLFKAYFSFFEAFNPEGFIMENVPGLLSMEKGGVLNSIIKTFEGAGYNITLLKLNASKYAVPQIRKRIFIIGIKKNVIVSPPQEILPTESLFNESYNLVTVKDAIYGLPEVNPGEQFPDDKDVSIISNGALNSFLTGKIGIDEYLNLISEEKRIKEFA